MTRYIDADELKRKFKHFCEGNCKRCGYSTFLADDEHCGLIDQAPTADVVEVVRCKDCKHGKWNAIECQYLCIGRGCYHIPDWYCADGRVKDASTQG